MRTDWHNQVQRHASRYNANQRHNVLVEWDHCHHGSFFDQVFFPITASNVAGFDGYLVARHPTIGAGLVQNRLPNVAESAGANLGDHGYVRPFDLAWAMACGLRVVNGVVLLGFIKLCLGNLAPFFHRSQRGFKVVCPQ